MRLMSADFEGDCYSNPFILYIVTGNGCTSITTECKGVPVYAEQQLIELASTQTVYVETSTAWNILQSRYPEPYRLLTGQLDSMLLASPWWSPVHLLDGAAEDIPTHFRYVIIAGWLANTSRLSRCRQLIRSMRAIRLTKRFTSRREA